jgi:protein ImuB
MSRIVSVWLKSWPIARLLQAQARTAAGSPADTVDPKRPLVLVAPGKGGPRLVALNRAAEESGLVAGELLSNARSKILDLQSCAADPAADDAALRRLALWCLRYTPLVAPWDEENGADGLFLDITGCAHLFGGEAGLLADLAGRLRRFNLRPRLAIADTPGTSWALARYGRADSMIVPPNGAERALQDLPLAALRLSEETQVLLRRLGFRRIADVIRQPRAPLAARFGAHFLNRLDQALGRAPEPLSPLAPPPVYRAQASFVEAITTQAHVVEAATRLLSNLAEDFTRDGVGARKLRLLLFRMDGELLSLTIGLAAPSRDARHIAGLIALRLDRLPSGLEADFGFEAAGLHVLAAERMPERQALLAVADEIGDPTGLSLLIDRLEQRLGAGAVRRIHPRQSHIPERAVLLRRAADGPLAEWAIDVPCNTRPLLLLPRPEAAEVMALIPEGPPRQFRWRGVLHQVAQAEGPERIAGEWWRQAGDEIERDYYFVEDAAGRRFWLYRAGLYGRDGATPQWFVHGVFP